jgi:hypothetical protein
MYIMHFGAFTILGAKGAKVKVLQGLHVTCRIPMLIYNFFTFHLIIIIRLDTFLPHQVIKHHIYYASMFFITYKLITFAK